MEQIHERTELEFAHILWSIIPVNVGCGSADLSISHSSIVHGIVHDVHTRIAERIVL